MDFRKMMSQAQEVQQRLQAEVENIRVEAAVGGGMVKVSMRGNKQLESVEIDPEVIDPSDPSMLQDLILTAVNEAAAMVDAQMQSSVGSLLPGMGFPPTT